MVHNGDVFAALLFELGACLGCQHKLLFTATGVVDLESRWRHQATRKHGTLDVLFLATVLVSRSQEYVK